MKQRLLADKMASHWLKAPERRPAVKSETHCGLLEVVTLYFSAWSFLQITLSHYITLLSARRPATEWNPVNYRTLRLILYTNVMYRQTTVQSKRWSKIILDKKTNKNKTPLSPIINLACIKKPFIIISEARLHWTAWFKKWLCIKYMKSVD